MSLPVYSPLVLCARRDLPMYLSHSTALDHTRVTCHLWTQTQIHVQPARRRCLMRYRLPQRGSLKLHAYIYQAARAHRSGARPLLVLLPAPLSISVYPQGTTAHPSRLLYSSWLRLFLLRSRLRPMRETTMSRMMGSESSFVTDLYSYAGGRFLTLSAAHCSGTISRTRITNSRHCLASPTRTTPLEGEHKTFLSFSCLS